MNYAIVLSGGTGTRLGSDIPKQYIKINGRDIISYCLKTICESNYIDGVVIVASPQWQAEIKNEIDILSTEMKPSENGCTISDKFLGFALPGENRQLSILSGLYKLRELHKTINNACDYSDVYVLIHDAARPNLSHELIRDCFTLSKGHDGVIPVLPMKDTVYLSDNGATVSALIDRSKVYAGQAPEAFRLDKYIAANEALLPDKILEINGSTEPAIIAGMDILMIPGDEGNFKITTKADLERFKEIVGEASHF